MLLLLLIMAIAMATLTSCRLLLQDIDLEDWKANTKYEGEAMSATGNQQVQWIWAVVEGFSEERRAMLQFAMASPNVPVGGVGRLRQSATGTLHPFTLISELPGRTATNTLPRADACFNTLYLPAFKSLEQMRQRVKVLPWLFLQEKQEGFLPLPDPLPSGFMRGPYGFLGLSEGAVLRRC